MKKLLAFTLLCSLLCTCLGLTAFADGGVTAYVTIADDSGKLVLAHKPVTVTDTDGDGVISMADVLFAAHEAYYEGGAAAGFSASLTAYGLSLDKLWGIENGGSYGYYLNNASPNSLADPVADGDTVAAYAYSDLTTWSDTYCYFDLAEAKIENGDSLTLTLSAAGYDAAWNPVVLPVEGATITIDGTATEVITDAEGKATLTLDEAGSFCISAVSDTQTLVPPVCLVTVSADIPHTGDVDTTALIALMLGSLCAMIVMLARRHNCHEK